MNPTREPLGRQRQEAPTRARHGHFNRSLLAPVAAAALVGLLLCGCAGYRLGPTNGLRSGEKSVQVNPFRNRILEEPRLSEYVTMAVRKHLQQDGTFTLDTHQEGDIIVDGALLTFDRSYISFVPRDVITPRDYMLVIKAQVTARDRRSGKVILDRPVIGRTTIRIGPDLTSVERQAAPLLADDLGRKITALLADGDW